ncbi:12984_t:CDS:2 [Dentiscutata heterogama]|uniref:12984_t:CDS:1 n=1 Tax=Dentiscutata heterogama TaxID=1316150 RepID=A0ACA9JWG5_9GLOM|nr:12984_t:CDS:2 [Dentiscutata heterogama]
MTTFYDFQVKDIDGNQTNFDKFKGKVVLVVNVASQCGFTKQYTGLEKLYQNYKNQDFYVLGFPCNQFGNQEPDTEKDIKDFCNRNYSVSFPMFSKIEVNGPNATPLYEFLKKCAPNDNGDGDIKWNFTKFLVDREGNVLRRYKHDVTPESIEGDISKLVKGE